MNPNRTDGWMDGWMVRTNMHTQRADALVIFEKQQQQKKTTKYIQVFNANIKSTKETKNSTHTI